MSAPAPTPAAAPASRVPGIGPAIRLPGTPVSFRVPRRSLVVAVVLAALGFVLFLLALGTGEFPIGPGLVLETLFGGGDQSTSFIVNELRLPRALDAVLVGLALGAAGAIFQSVTRNPLGSPDIIGFTQGASAGAVLQILVLDNGAGGAAVGALVGGLTTAVIVYLLAYRGGVQGYRLVLVGIGMSFLAIAVTDYLLTRAKLEEAQGAQVWLTGSLNGRGWEHVVPVGIALAVLLPFVVAMARGLRSLELGDAAATALGIRVERSRLGILLVAVLLTAVATASAGPVLFVALMAPQISRRLTGATGPGIGNAALTGAVVMLASDLFAQRVFPDVQLPVGVVTGVTGGLFLIWLLDREWRGRRA